jgi:hypothetical protein
VKPRTDLAHVGGLAKVDVDVGDLVVLEKSEDVLSRAVGSRSGGGVGGDANPDSDGTDDRVLSLAFFVVVLDDFLETNDIDRCKTNLEILVSKLYKDCNNDNNSNDDNDDDDDSDGNGSDDDDYDDSAAVAAAIARLLSLLPH